MTQLRTAFLKNGFTLLEVLVVIVIIGTLASIAIPMYTTAVEKSISAEGVEILRVLREAQERYKLTHGGFYTDSLKLVSVQ